MGNAGVGVVRVWGAIVALLTFATAQCKRFFDSGRAIRCLLPLGGGRFMNLVVSYGYQGADDDAEQLALTEQLFVARGQPFFIVGDFDVEPTKIPCLSKGISAGLWVDFEAAWALARGVQPASTWGSTGDHRRDFVVGYTLAAAAVSDCKVEPGKVDHPPSGRASIVVDGLARSLSLSSAPLFGLLLGWLLWIQVEALSLRRCSWFGIGWMSLCW